MKVLGFALLVERDDGTRFMYWSDEVTSADMDSNRDVDFPGPHLPAIVGESRHTTRIESDTLNVSIAEPLERLLNKEAHQLSIPDKQREGDV